MLIICLFQILFLEVIYMLKENIELVNTYMKFRNCYNQGFQKYYYFKRIISYTTDITDGTQIRTIFQKMLDEEYIERSDIPISKNKTVLRYRHNPYHIDGLKFYEKDNQEGRDKETNKNKKIKK